MTEGVSRRWSFGALVVFGAIASGLIAICVLSNPAETRWVALALVGVLGIVVFTLANEVSHGSAGRALDAFSKLVPWPTGRRRRQAVGAAPGPTSASNADGK